MGTLLDPQIPHMQNTDGEDLLTTRVRFDVLDSAAVEAAFAATKELGLKVPLVVRLEGTNVELGRKILSESGLAIQAATTMADGAKKIVDAVVAGGAK